MRDVVKDYLATRGCPPDLCEGGLAGLVARWEAIVDEVRGGYALGLDDYLNDLDLRDILEGALAVAGSEAEVVRPRVTGADERFVAQTAECPLLWEEEDRPPGLKGWWYRRRPLQPGEELREELLRKGLL